MPEANNDSMIFVQARMSSSRFPGKVLAPFRGLPLIDHVMKAALDVRGPQAVVLLTSTEQSDDPLAIYALSKNWNLFRGNLDDVYGRFMACLEQYPCQWMLRVCADSPLMDPEMLQIALDFAPTTDCDLLTNVFPRSFPKGLSVEVINTTMALSIDAGEMSESEREHVTTFFYENSDRFKILNFSNSQPVDPEPGLAIDTLEDLRRLEKGAPPASFAKQVVLPDPTSPTRNGG